jgi:predicted secreted hydrolase
MNSRRRLVARATLLLAASLACVAATQRGPSAAGEQAPGPTTGIPIGPAYRPAAAPYVFRFPADHAAHPEYQTEWWYYTGNLADDAGREYGYQLTFFAVGLNPALRYSRSAWAAHTIYFAHLAVTEVRSGTFHFAERLGRPALGMAGALTDRYRVWIEEWSAELAAEGSTHRLRAGAPTCGLALDLVPEKSPVVHGRDGVSRKGTGPGRASHYYSLTRLRTSGSLRVGDRRAAVRGYSWMDHEFGSNQLSADQQGWDWFSLQLDDGSELMLYVLRRRDGSTEPVSSGTLVRPGGGGGNRHLPLQAFSIAPTRRWRSPHTGAIYPAGWKLAIPSERLELEVSPRVADQELRAREIGVNYWEGAVSVVGRRGSTPVAGKGYVELTGYAGPVPGF